MATVLPIWEGHDAAFWQDKWKAGEVRLYESVTSTNDVALSMAYAGAPHFAVVIAEEQTKGRGRGTARWYSKPHASLLMSVLIRLEQTGPCPGCAPLRIGLAVADAIESVTGDRALLKWPNDVVMDGHGKVAGILCEASLGQEASSYVVAGIGINISQEPEDFGDSLRNTATSLRMATNEQVDRTKLLAKLMKGLHAAAKNLTQPLTAKELQAFKARDLLSGESVLVENNKTVLALGIAPDGALLIEENGAERKLYNGSVRLADHAYPGATVKK